MMLATERPMAPAISSVRNVPDAPTSVPATSSRVLDSTYPPAATVSPVNALSSEMTIGTSAPPTGSTSSTPTSRPTSASTTPTHIVGSLICSPASTTEPIRAAPNTTGRPGKTTGREVISSWSLAKVITEPAKETEPTRIVNAVASSTNQPGPSRPRSRTSTISCSSSNATSAAAPPPTPLNSATICGIWVICTVRAP